MTSANHLRLVVLLMAVIIAVAIVAARGPA